LLVLFFLESAVILYSFFQWSERKDTAIKFWERLDDYGKTVVMSNWDCCGWDTTCNTNTEIYHEYKAYKDTLCYNSTAGDYKKWVESVGFVLGVTAGFHLLYVMYPCVCQGRRLRRKWKEKIREGASKKKWTYWFAENEISDSETTTSYEMNTIQRDKEVELRTSSEMSSKRSKQRRHSRSQSFNQERRSRSKEVELRASGQKSSKRSKQRRHSRSNSFNQGRRSRNKRGDSRSKRRRDVRSKVQAKGSANPESSRQYNIAPQIRKENAMFEQGERVIAQPNVRPYTQYLPNAHVNDSKTPQPVAHRNVNPKNYNVRMVKPEGKASRRTNSGGAPIDFINPSIGSFAESPVTRSNQFNNFSMYNNPQRDSERKSKMRRSKSVGTPFDYGYQANAIGWRKTNMKAINHPSNRSALSVNSRMGGSTVRSAIPYIPERQPSAIEQMKTRSLNLPSINMARYPSSVMTEPIHGSFYAGTPINPSISEVQVSQQGSLYSVVPNNNATSTGQFYYSIQDLNPV